MRRIIFPWLLFLAACGSKQDNKAAAKNENTDYPVSMEGIGPVKTEMSQTELEKILQQKIPLTNPTDTVSGSWTDSAVIRYKDAELRLRFERTYAFAAAPDSFYMRVTEIKSGHQQCKTAEGIGIGSGKQQVIDAYPGNLLIMEPGYDSETDTTYSKTLYTIKIRQNREGPQIVCYLRNNRVYAFEVSSFHDDAE